MTNTPSTAERRRAAIARLAMIVSSVVAALILGSMHLALFPSDVSPRMDLFVLARGNVTVWLVDAALFSLIALSLIGVECVLRQWPRLADMPNQGYWLAPERIHGTVSELVVRLHILGIIVIAWLFAVTLLVSEWTDDFTGRNRMGTHLARVLLMWSLLLAPLGVWLLLYIRRFWRVEEEG
jgi:hypothetical protein